MQASTIIEAAVFCTALRWPLIPDMAQRLTQRKIISLTRRAKYLLIALDGNETLVGSGRLTLVMANTRNSQRRRVFFSRSSHSGKAETSL